MAEELDDGEFWLPSQFLTDDDILMDFAKSDGFGSGFGSGSSSDLGSLTTETEISDDDDLLFPGLTRRFSRSSLNGCPVHSKVAGLSSSPQSTLLGCECNHQGSSHGSPTGPVSPQPRNDAVKTEERDKNDNDDKTNTTAADNNKNNATLDLLNKAAGEVAKMKMRSDRSTGTGFFDCSNSAKGLLCPPQPPLPQRNQPPHYAPPPPYYSHPQFRQFSPHMMWGPVQLPPPQPQQQQLQQQNRVPTKNTTTTNNTNNNKTSNGTTNGNTRPLGLPPSAWPPLPGQTAQPQPQAQPPQPQPQPMMGMYVAPPNTSVGTGVFLPRRVTTPAESKKKTDGNAMKTKNNKASQKRNPRPAKANDDAILLPSEWVY